MIGTLAVVGTGLMGTSVALAARRAGVRVFLCDRDEQAARTAAELGAGLLEEPAGPVDLAVLAVPPSQIGPVLAEAQRRGLARAYTDVAGVKAEPERAVWRTAPEPEAWVGGHPMAGSERSGPLAARADLFTGRPWALTPSPGTRAAVLRRALELVALCGATPVITTGSEHDAAVALTSHVPHLVSSLTAARLPEGPPVAERLVGPGLRDVTRIAAGDPELWSDIVRANAPAILSVLRELQADLSTLVPALEALASGSGGGEEALLDLLRRGVTGVSRIRLPVVPGALADPHDRVDPFQGA